MPAKAQGKTAPAVTVTEAQVVQLVKMLRLLGSDQLGERAAAAFKVHAWVKARGLDWQEMLLPEEKLPEVTVRVGGADQSQRAQQLVLEAQRVKAQAEAEIHQARLMAALATQATQEANRKLAEAKALVAARTPAEVVPWRSDTDVGVPFQHGGTRPPWLKPCETMLQQFPMLLRGSTENQFLADQIARGLKYGADTRLSEKQEGWMRAILARAGLTW